MSTSSTRRQFLARTAASAAVLGALDASPGEAQARKSAPIPIIDTHQHLWDFRKFQPPWLNDAPKLNRSFTMEDYLEASRGLNVVKAVYMEVDVDPKQQVEEAEYVIETSKSGKTPMVAGVISGRPASPGFEKYIRRFEGNPYIKGVRQVLHVPSCPRGFCTQPDFIKSIRLLGKMGLSFDLCMRPADLTDGMKLVDACPDTRFVLDHCGNGNAQHDQEARSQWARDMVEFGKRPNVICKVSGIVATCKPEQDKARALEPIVLHTLRAFGPDRVMFASDWPVCLLAASYREWVESLQRIVRSESAENQRKLFHDNAVRFYGLK